MKGLEPSTFCMASVWNEGSERVGTRMVERDSGPRVSDLGGSDSRSFRSFLGSLGTGTQLVPIRGKWPVKPAAPPANPSHVVTGGGGVEPPSEPPANPSNVVTRGAPDASDTRDS